MTMLCPKCGKDRVWYGVFVAPFDDGDEYVFGWLCQDCHLFFDMKDDAAQNELWAAQESS